MLTISLQLSAQKKSLDHSVYDSWQSIGEKLISNDGSIVVYTINPQEGDATLVIQNSNGAKIMEVQRGYAAKITNDGKFVVFKIKSTYQQTREAKIKKKKAEDNGYKMIYIWENEITYKSDTELLIMVKSKLMENGYEFH